MHHRLHDQHPGGLHPGDVCIHGGGLHPGDLPMGGLSTEGRLSRHPGTRKEGDTHPTGMLSCFTTSEENKMKAVTKIINFTVNLYLS